ncbi:MAG: hypothetical protein JJV97_05020 [SAR324 cluster bacterium]|nr:hypothetical protein [SAR324 cluster bacterium]
MIRNIILATFIWGVTLVSQLFINHFLDRINLNLFSPISLLLFFLIRQRYGLIILLAFHLTSDAWVSVYPGILTLGALVVGLLFLRLQDHVDFESRIIFYSLIFSSIFFIKIGSFLIILGLGKINLFNQFLTGTFWIEISLEMLATALLLEIMMRVTKNRLNFRL